MMRPAITGGARASPVIRSFGSEAGLKAARSSAAATRASTQGLYAIRPQEAPGRPAPGLGDNRHARVAFSPTSCRDACGAVGDRVRGNERIRRRASALELGRAEIAASPGPD